MLSERSKLLLSLLCEKGTVGQSDVQDLFGVSQRTIHNDLIEIDEFLSKYGLDPISKQTVTNYSVKADSSEVMQLIKEDGQSNKDQVNYWEEPNFRLGFEYSKLFWHDTRLTIEYFVKTLSVSRSTVNSDLKRLKKTLKDQKIMIQFDKKRGLYLQGNERDLRHVYFKFFWFLKNLNYSLEIINTFDRLVISNWLRAVEKDLMVEFTYDSFEKMLVKTNIIVRRIQMGHYIQNIAQTSMKRPNNEFNSLRHRCKMLDHNFDIVMPDSEVNYLLQAIYTSSLVRNEVIAKGYNVKVDFLVNRFIEGVGQKLKIDLTMDQELFHHLALHFQTTLTKRQDHLTNLITEATFEKIQHRFSIEYDAVKQSIGMLSKSDEPVLISLKNPQEYSFLTLHIVSAVEKIKKRLSKEIRVLLICHLGVGTSQFLKYRLNQIAKFRIDIASMDNLHRKVASSDMVISTIFLPEMQIPYIKVSPILNEIDIDNIVHLENKIITQKLQQKVDDAKEWEKSPMLKDLLTEKTIETNVHVDSWEEAIIHGGKILENNGDIDNTYTDAMVNAVKTFGPYIVIAPHIALAHASSKDGVHKISMSLSVLDHGVDFGNEENDPVNVVICLAAIDHHTHLKALSELVTNIGDPAFAKMLMSSSKAEIVDYIQNKEREVE